jgi:hypothetical protein
MNPVGTASSCPVDYAYQPLGVPSPFLTAQRGVYEELSEGLYWSLKDEPHRFKFLNIVMDLEYFNPHLVGIIDLGMTRAEVKKHLEETPGKDHSEATAIDFVKLDSRDPSTMKLISDKPRWSAVGLSALITAVHYWEAQRAHNSPIP